MNKSLLNGFRDSNPRDLINQRGRFATSAYNRRGYGSQNDIKNTLKNRYAKQFATKYEYIHTSPVFVGKQIRYVVPTANSVTFFAIDDPWTGVITALTTTDFISWTTQTAAALSPLPEDYTLSQIIWTGEVYLMVGWRSATNTLYGYYTTNFATWTSFVIATGLTSNPSIMLTAGRNYVLAGLYNSSTDVATYVIQKPVSSPIITTVSAAYSAYSVVSLNLSTNVYMVGPRVTSNFVTYDQVIPANSVFTQTQPEDNGGLLCMFNSLGTVSYSRDGFTWTRLFNGTSQSSNATVYEIASPYGPVVISSEGYAFTFDGYAWPYDPHNIKEDAYSSNLNMFKYKNELYWWGAPYYSNIRRLSAFGTTQQMSLSDTNALTHNITSINRT